MVASSPTPEPSRYVIVLQIRFLADEQIVADLAASMAIKLVDEKRLPFTSTSNEEKFKLDAQRFARADAKRALRESGYYKHHELGPFEDEERAAPRKI